MLKSAYWTSSRQTELSNYQIQQQYVYINILLLNLNPQLQLEHNLHANFGLEMIHMDSKVLASFIIEDYGLPWKKICLFQQSLFTVLEVSKRGWLRQG